MDNTLRKKVTSNLSFIKESICDDLDTFVDGLIEKDVLNLDIKDKIDSARTPKEKSDSLIRIIINKGSKALHEFVGLLQRNNYDHVLRKMEEAEAEGVGSSQELVVYNQERTLIESSSMESDGACGGVTLVEKKREETSNQFLEAKERYEETCHESKYKLLQNAYIGAKKQLAEKEDRMNTLRQEKAEIEKKLQEVNSDNTSLRDENTKLKHEETKLKSAIQELKRQVREKEDKLSVVEEKFNKFEQMWKEDRESREGFAKEMREKKDELSVFKEKFNKFEQMWMEDRESRESFTRELKKVNERVENESHNQNKKMDDIVQILEKLTCTRNPRNTNNSGNRQPFVTGTKSTSGSSCNKRFKKKQKKEKK